MRTLAVRAGVPQLQHRRGAAATASGLTPSTRAPTPSNAGTDVGPKGIGDKVFLACSPENVDKYKLRTWSFDGEILGDKVSAGDGVHEGTWNVNFKGAENPWTGIRWKDGNRWLKLDEAGSNPAGSLKNQREGGSVQNHRE